jgi:hypothetical protein
MRYLLLIALLGVTIHSPAQVMTVITTLHDGSRDTIKFGFVQNATIGEDVALGEENIFMTPVIGYEGRILQRDQDSFSCAMLNNQPPIYYVDNFDSKVNYRNPSDTSLQNRLFETWYSDSNTDSLEMICDIPISSFLQIAYLHVDDCDSDPPAPVAILVIQDDTVTHTKMKIPLGISIKQLIYITEPGIILTSHDDHTIEKEISDLTVFPNPTQQTFTIQLHNHQKIEGVSIFNSIGQLLFWQLSNTSIAEIDLRAFSKGIYIIVVTSSNGDRAIKKVLKQ